MNAIVPLTGGRPPAAFARMTNLPDLTSAASANLQASFAIIGYKASKWRLRFRGEDEMLLDDRNAPIPVLPVVIVGISPSISKLFYEKRYTDGDDASPDCFSTDGITPDAAALKKQCATCAACPMNIWGSRITEAGKKAKACQDSRRIAVVPRGDIENETYGGPMLLRVPPMSLNNLASYGKELARYGAQPYMVGTELSFDFNVAYPLITFKASGWLGEGEAELVGPVLNNPLIPRLLADASVETSAQTGPAASTADALAGGAPAGTFDAEAQAAAQQAAAQQAAAQQAAAQQAAAQQAAAQQAAAQQAAAQQAAAQQAAAQQAAAQQAAAQQAAPKRSPFGGAARPAATTQQTAPPPSNPPSSQVPATTQTTTPVATTQAATQQAVVQQAPADLESAIDALLAS